MKTTNIKSLSEFISKTTIDKHYDCCKKVYLNTSFIIDGETVENDLDIVVPFKVFEDIKNDFIIYEFGYDKFKNFLETVVFNDIFEKQKNELKTKRLQNLN